MGPGDRRPRKTLSQVQSVLVSLDLPKAHPGPGEECGCGRGRQPPARQEVAAAMRARGGWRVDRRRRDREGCPGAETRTLKPRFFPELGCSPWRGAADVPSGVPTLGSP